MGNGVKFIRFVEELKEIGFPIDKVTGGDIQNAFVREGSVRDAIYYLHGQAEKRRKMKQINKTH